MYLYAFQSPVPLGVGKRPARLHVCTRMTAWDPAVNAFPKRVSRAVVWFRPGDMRVEDHGGLEAACAHTADALAALLVATPKTTSEDLVAASRLHSELKARGSALFLRYADDEATGVAQFLSEYGAERVHVHMDAETEVRDVVSDVERLTGGQVSVQAWHADLREWDETDMNITDDIPSEYPRFLKWGLRREASILPSTAGIQPEVIVPGPGTDEAVQFPFDDIAVQISRVNAESQQRKEFLERIREEEDSLRTVRVDALSEHYGEKVLKEFLERSDQYQRPDLGRSLSEILRQGALSPRRIHELVHAHERKNGRIWRFVYREAAKTILDFLDSREFVNLRARRDLELKGTTDGENEAKYWRWRGFLTRYTEVGQENGGSEGKPPLLLIHGFGASSFHYRRSLRLLKQKYHVYAIDMIGFGRSEKPPLQYTQDLWEHMIWDFVREVIRRPVFVAGNSIGGYMSLSFGTDSYNDLCLGVCLLNSAGKLEDPSSAANNRQSRKGPFKYFIEEYPLIRYAMGNFLLRNLQGRIKSTLRQVYPVNPAAADEELATEIQRDSLDYGAVEVLASGLVLPPSRSLSELLRQYRGPLLIFQGRYDPLGNPVERANRIRNERSDATVVLAEAGHCPHEEAAEAFVDAISNWMDALTGGADTSGVLSGELVEQTQS